MGIRLWNYERDPLLSYSGTRYRRVNIFFEKIPKNMGFSKKWGWCAQYRSLPFPGLVRLGFCAHFHECFIFYHSTCISPKSAKNRILGHFLTSDVILGLNDPTSFAIWLIGLMKLFSLGRTDLAVSSKLPAPVGIANCRRTIIVLRTSVMVWYTWRSPWTRRFGAVGPVVLSNNW